MQLRNGACIASIALIGGLTSTAAIADDIFLKFVGIGGAASDIVGDSTDAQHPNEIVVLSYSLDVTADSSYTNGGGASIGKPIAGDMQFTAAMNRSIPTIFGYITNGKAAPSARLTVRTDTGTKRPGDEYAKYTFTDILFTNVEQRLNGVGRAVSAVSFAYKTVTIQEFAPGNPVAVSCNTWDVSLGSSSPC